MRQNCAINKYYAPIAENKTAFERKVDRLECDGVRNYDASQTQPIADLLPSIKAVRLG